MLSERVFYVRFECGHFRLSQHETKRFPDGKLQQENTTKILEHRRKNHKKITVKPTNTEPSSENCRKIKISTKRPTNADSLCPFHFVIFKGDDNFWYLSSKRHGHHVDPIYHLHHRPTISDHVATPQRDLSDDAVSDIQNCFDSHMACNMIKLFIQTKYQISVTDSVLRAMQDEYVNRCFEKIDRQLNAY